MLTTAHNNFKLKHNFIATSLNIFRLHFAIDDVITGNILDMSAYFSTAVTLADLTWCSRKKDLGSKPCPMEAMALNYLLLRFQVIFF